MKLTDKQKKDAKKIAKFMKTWDDRNLADINNVKLEDIKDIRKAANLMIDSVEEAIKLGNLEKFMKYVDKKAD